MNDPSLHQLLREADQSPPDVDVLRVTIGATNRARRRQRQRLEILRAALLLFMVLGLSGFLVRRERTIIASRSIPQSAKTTIPATTAVATMPSRSDFAQLQAQADLDQRIADAIIMGRRLREAHATAAQVDPLDRLKQELDSTASVLVSAGDRWAADPSGAAQAASFYNQVSRDFPDTRYAAIAAQHELQLAPPKIK
jgi:hypothetical protein